MSNGKGGMTSNYVLCAELRGHDDQVRSVSSYALLNGGVLSGSLDTLIKVWQLKEEEQYKQQLQQLRSEERKNATVSRYICMATLVGHQYFVSDLLYVPPNSKYPNGQIISVSHDKSIIFWNPLTASIEHRIHEAHDSAITCIALDVNNPDRFITGSWDK
jgi:WD40 repeat protein